MPAAHLNSTGSPDPQTTRSGLESAVVAVLAGTPLAQAAARARIAPQLLHTAARNYQAAGRAALDSDADADAARWMSIVVEFPDRGLAERCAATKLLPTLAHAEDTGELESWWFVRKSPEWRWRLRARPGRADDLLATITGILAAQHPGITWSRRPYEAETAAFGGAEAMAVAHRFFHADSRAVLDHLLHRPGTGTTGRLGERETSLLLSTALLRGADLDWHEQGDVWAHVAELRPPATVAGHHQAVDANGLVDKVRHLLQLDIRALLGSGGEPVHRLGPWLASASHTGETLRALADNGRLHRGLRAVTAHHVVFHWNRLGLSTTTQTVLAHAATTAVLGPREELSVPHVPR